MEISRVEGGEEMWTLKCTENDCKKMFNITDEKYIQFIIDDDTLIKCPKCNSMKVNLINSSFIGM